MRASLAAVVAAVLGLATAPQAGAGMLTSASLSLSSRWGAAFPSFTFTATGIAGGQAFGSGAGATWSVPAGALPVGQGTTTIPSSAAPPISQIEILASGNPAAGAFAASAGGSMLGSGRIHLLGSGGITLFIVPIRYGSSTAFSVEAYGIGFTGMANAWTTKTTTLPLTTPSPGGATRLTAMGANALVAGAGAVVLVSSVNLLSSIAGQIPTFAVLTLNYAPEPAGLALVGSGFAALGLVGWRRRRRR